jgi:hypothetical protein
MLHRSLAASRALPKGREFLKDTLAGNVPEKSVTVFFLLSRHLF